MADDHGLEVFSKQFGEVLAELGESGAKLPFYVVALAVNGTTLWAAWKGNGTGTKLWYATGGAPLAPNPAG